MAKFHERNINMCGINIPAVSRESIHNTGVTEEQHREMMPNKYVLSRDVLLIGRYIQGQIIRKALLSCVQETPT